MPRSLSGAPISHLEVLVSHHGVTKPIPFQVDERLPDGRFALPKGREPLQDDSPGVLDDDDELVLMISDLGERSSNTTEIGRDAAEIEVVDPLDNQKHYAYVARVAAPRISPADYVDYDPAAGRVESEHYRLGLTHEVPTDFALQSHKGEGRASLIDRLKVRLSARILLGLLNFRVSEGDVRNELMAYTDGPVRVVRRLRHSINIALGIRSPKVTSEDFFYRDYIDNPFDVSLPWVPRFVFGDIVIRAYLDFIDLKGYQLSWSGIKGAPVTTGRVSAAEVARLDGAPVDWLALRGDGQVIVQTLVFGPDLAAVQRQLLYEEGSTPDPPENYPGNHPGVGYMMTGWEGVSRGRHPFDSILLKGSGKDFDPNRLLKELRVPPSVTVRQRQVE